MYFLYMVRKITRKIWLMRFAKIHGDLYDYDKSIFDRCFTRIKIYCKLCKMYFRQSTISHSRGSGCKVCATKRTHKAQMHTDEMVEAVFHQVHNYKYIYNDFYRGDNDKNYTITCPDHGDFKMQPSNHKQGNGCKKCGYIKIGKKLRLLWKNVKKQFIKAHNDKYIYNDKYRHGNDKNYTITCPEHGDFKCTPRLHKRGVGCPKCKNSRLESAISYVLEEDLMVDYTSQHKFDKCKDTHCLPFDFYIPNGQIYGENKFKDIFAIEGDGIQHDKPIDIFGGLEKFKTQVKRDHIKNQYCKDNGIRLIRISHRLFSRNIDVNIIRDYLADKFEASWEQICKDLDKQEKIQQDSLLKHEKIVK